MRDAGCGMRDSNVANEQGQDQKQGHQGRAETSD